MPNLLDLSAVPVNFKVNRGDTFEFTVVLKESGTAVNVSAFSFLFEVFHPRTGAVVFSAEIGNGIEFESAFEKVRATMTGAETLALSPISYPYSFKFTTPENFTRTPFFGYLAFKKVGAVDCFSSTCSTNELVIENNLVELNFDLGAGIPGDPGPIGQGVPPGGTIGQFLQKTGAGDFQTGWVTVAPGGGGTDLTSLPTYKDDAAAALGLPPLGSGDFYWVAIDSDAHPGGSLRRIP
jgi:hypothetical protein